MRLSVIMIQFVIHERQHFILIDFLNLLVEIVVVEMGYVMHQKQNVHENLHTVHLIVVR